MKDWLKEFSEKYNVTCNDGFTQVNANISIQEMLKSLGQAESPTVVVSNSETKEYFLVDREKLMQLALEKEKKKTKSILKNYFPKKESGNLDKKTVHSLLKNFLPQNSLDKNELDDLNEFDLPGSGILTVEEKVIGFFNKDWKEEVEAVDLPEAPPSPQEFPPQPADVEPASASTYFLNASFKDKLQLQEEFSVHVNLAKKGGGKKNIPLLLQTGSRITVCIVAEEGLEILGPDAGELVAAEGEESPFIRFKLKAVSPGNASLILIVYLGTRQAGSMKLKMEVSETGNAGSGEVQVPGEEFKPAKGGADLALAIRERNNELLFTLLANSPELVLNQELNPVPLTGNAKEYIKVFFKEIEKLETTTEADRKKAIAYMKQRGLNLFETLLPPPLQAHLWKLKDRIKSILISSAEPWIPWELCTLSGKGADGRVEEGLHFCEAFEISRWIVAEGKQPPGSLNFSSAALIVPKDSKLENAVKEKAELENIWQKEGYRVENIPAQSGSITSAFSRGEISLWHFSGHGVNLDQNIDENATLMLDDGDKLPPSSISGKTRNLGLAHPFLFFNACQVGRPSLGLTGVGGWAEKLISNDAAGFLGALWNVNDKLAYTFAVKFYEEMENGKTVAQAVREARNAIKATGDPTWLAYTLYADPNAKLVAWAILTDTLQVNKQP